MSDLLAILDQPSITGRVLVDPATGCWLWQGYRQRQGYGQIHVGRRVWQAHRYVWTLLHGEIPADGYICHRCDNPPCCNPDHLFLGDALINTRDMFAKGRNRNGKEERTHCRANHLLSADNVRIDLNSGGRPKRTCRTCARRRASELAARRKAARQARRTAA